MQKEGISFSGAAGIRGLACLLVVVIHSISFFFNGLFKYLNGSGKIGVWLFFVLSAFLLTVKFMRTGFDFRAIAYYLNGRILRIIPLFSIVVFIYYYFGTAGIDTFEDLKAALFFDKAYAHLWTIPVEFKFYFILPLLAGVLIFLRRKFGVGAVLIASALSIFSHQVLAPYWNTPTNGVTTYWYLPSFLFGCIAAVLFDTTRKWVTPASSAVVGLMCVVLIFMMTGWARNTFFGMPLDGWLQNKFIFLSAILTVFLLAFIEPKGVGASIFESPVFKKAGEWSFSIYLIHWLIVVKLSDLYPGSLLWMLVAIVASIFAGAALYMLVEKPIERFRHSIERASIRRRSETA